MNTQTQNQQKPELLWVDERGKKIEFKNMMKGAVDLNAFVRECEKQLGSIDNDQREKLREEGMQYLINEVRKKFQFPNATDEFNLQALGLDFTLAKSKYTRTWRGYEFEITENGDFVLRDDQKRLADYNYYATDSSQLEALKMVDELNDLAQRLENIGGQVNSINGQVVFNSNIFTFSTTEGKKIGVNFKEVALRGKQLLY